MKEICESTLCITNLIISYVYVCTQINEEWSPSWITLMLMIVCKCMHAFSDYIVFNASCWIFHQQSIFTYVHIYWNIAICHCVCVYIYIYIECSCVSLEFFYAQLQPLMIILLMSTSITLIFVYSSLTFIFMVTCPFPLLSLIVLILKYLLFLFITVCN